MQVQAIFADGSIVAGATYHEVELALRGDAWNPSKKRPFRAELALRAWNWSRHGVNEEGRSRDFLQGLEQAGILRLEVTP